MLFEIDEVINSGSHGNFVRWMDDINIGVDSKDDAYSLLGDVNEVLKSRGLALNLSKTKIYSSDEAKIHFMFDENTYLDEVNKLKPSAPDFRQKKKEFVNRFRLHLKNSQLRNWDKVTKRYFNIAGKLRILELRKYTYNIFLNYPSVRGNIMHYFSRLGFSKTTSKIIAELIHNIKRYDDVTLYDFCRLITDMEIPRTKVGKEFIKSIVKILRDPKSDFDLYCTIWFLAKYGEPYVLMNLIERTKEQWRNENFLARQVVSVLPRLLSFNEDMINKLINEQMSVGPRDAASVAISINSLSHLEILSKPHKYLFQYLFPPNPQRPYPLPKYLILTSVLSSKLMKPAERKRAINKVGSHITDAWYIHWLKKYKLY